MNNKQRIRLRQEPDLSAKHVPFPFQQEAVESIKDLEYAAVFHEQGLGKSKIAIDLALYWLHRKSVDTVVVVTKKGLLANWIREFKAHTYTEPRVLSQNKRANFYVFNTPCRLVLTHYEVLRSELARLKLFLKSRAVAVIMDESARIKNPNTSVAQAAHELAPLFERRVIMTGTPVANRPFDLWSQVYFLDQGESLGEDFGRFKADFDLSNKLGVDESAKTRFETELAAVFAKISKFSVRETKTGGVVELPEKVYQTVLADWEDEQYRLYRAIRSDMRAVVVKEGVPTEDDSDQLLKRLVRLVQVASNPVLVDEAYRAEPGKLECLTEVVEKICSNGEKCIIWTSFTSNADALKQEYRRFGAVVVHGKMGMDSRDQSIQRFLEKDDARVLVATPGAAKEGLTLTVANHVIFYDRSFSLDDYLQAQDRIHRISQKRTCYVYNILMRDSIDEWVDQLLRSKHLAAQLAQGDITLEQYQELMSYDFGEILKRILAID